MLSYCISIRFCNLCQHSSWKREWSIIILVGIFIAPWIINIWQQQRAVQSDSHQLILQFTFPVFVILLDMDIILITLANESWFNFVFGILEQSIDLSERHSQVWCVWSYIYISYVRCRDEHQAVGIVKHYELNLPLFWTSSYCKMLAPSSCNLNEFFSTIFGLKY